MKAARYADAAARHAAILASHEEHFSESWWRMERERLLAKRQSMIFHFTMRVIDGP